MRIPAGWPALRDVNCRKNRRNIGTVANNESSASYEEIGRRVYRDRVAVG